MKGNEKRRVLPPGLYCITAEEHSRGRKNIEVAGEMIRGGAPVIQYREKENKTQREKFMDCIEIRKMTADAGVMFIVNDDIGLALSVGADGIHVGQDDMPVRDVRKIAPGMIIGLSTHSPEQARLALADGADYIGVGPIYKTFTKKNVVDPVGLEYLDFVARNIDIPFTAIGGIKENNIGQIVSGGAKSVAIVTAVVGADDIAGKVREFNSIILGKIALNNNI